MEIPNRIFELATINEIDMVTLPSLSSSHLIIRFRVKLPLSVTPTSPIINAFSSTSSRQSDMSGERMVLPISMARRESVKRD